ncbi:hypothetical protein NDW01_41140 [Actinoallomurus sp. WRP6H-15]|nr:hypothetical protein [Actinoallomurus soli]MCO5974820.1 hypothetical protein [Actinoallomurus soli]
MVADLVAASPAAYGQAAAVAFDDPAGADVRLGADQDDRIDAEVEGGRKDGGQHRGGVSLATAAAGTR